MITGLIVMGSIAAYTCGAAAVARPFYRNSLEDAAIKEAERRKSYRYLQFSDPLIDELDRDRAAQSALFAGLFWWAVLVIWLLTLGSDKSPYVPPTEQARLDRLELKRLRKQAEELNLPMGDGS